MKERLQKKFKELQKKDKKGFTLIELIVVLVILGIVLALTVPAITSYIDDANDSKHLANARAVFIAAEVERTKDIANGTVAADADWPATAKSKDTVVSTVATVDAEDVAYDVDTKTYTFKLKDAGKTISVTGNKEIKVTN